ncbi:MAG: aminotransferase class I/II-fold pyridoxal phosphate-dependent enzyme [Candidatus Hydrogenedentes bacterium]|nr:aminotransferase class I/II-fold pyridoxal phosphate-dependent enzyme [Candidatus Hydrogenedentota bacterium]
MTESVSYDKGIIDLRSDTLTQPSAGMRQAMADAVVADDVYGEDPTVNRLQDVCAELMGKDAALFFPSGTMVNLAACLAQTRPGDSIILSESAHPFHYENANLAMVAGLLPRVIPDLLGKFSAEQVEAQVVYKDDAHLSPTTLVSVENTTNRGGGAYWDLYEMESVAAVCQRYKMRLHCDGARIFNACAVANIEARYYAKCCDTLCFCLSKGLGAPAGSVLVGDRDSIHKDRRFRKMLGGGMRQAGILAAAGLYALEHHRQDLSKDHDRARRFRRALEAEGITFALPSPTNILYITVADADHAVQRLKERGVRVLAHNETRLRVVFHRDIDDQGLEKAIEAFKQCLPPLH